MPPLEVGYTLKKIPVRKVGFSPIRVEYTLKQIPGQEGGPAPATPVNNVERRGLRMNHLSYDREDTPNAAPGCKPTFLTWNLFRCAFGHEGGKPSFLTGIFFNVYPTSSGTSSPPYLECVSGRERGQALLPDLLMFFNVQPGGGKPTFLTWNLLRCVSGWERASLRC